MRSRQPLSFRTRLMLTIMLAVLLPVTIVNYFTFHLIKQQMLEDSSDWLQGMIANTGASMDSYLQLVQGTTKNPLFDHTLMDIFDAKRPGNSNFVKEYSYEERAQIYGWLAMLANMDRHIVSTVIYDSSGQRFHVHENDVLFDEQLIIRQTGELGGASLVSEPMYGTDDKIVFCISRAMINPANFRQLATLLIYFRIDILENSYEDNHADSINIILIDPQRTIIVDNDRSRVGQTLEFQSDSIAYAEYASSLTNWTLIGSIPTQVLFENISRLQRWVLFINLMLFLFTIVLIYVSSSRITRPLLQLSKLMQIAHRTKFREVSFPVRRHDEIGRIATRFNQMMNEIHQLIDKVIDTERRRKEAQITALQAQFNPHFLYNSLYMITMQAELDKNYKISEMSFLLSKLLRYSVGKHGIWVPVKQECDHFQTYMRLMQYRFPKISFVMDVDEKAGDGVMMRLMLQPIVENAILHGLVPKDGDGEIRLSLKLMHGDGGDRKQLEVTIEDDGIGMSAESEKRLLEDLRSPNIEQDRRHGIGIKNVYERLELFYEEQFRFEFTSREGAGTKCRIIVPHKAESL